MKKELSNIIEFIGVQLCKVANRKKSDENLFKELEMEDVNSIYSDVKVFNRCDTYHNPVLENEKTVGKVKVVTYSMPSKYDPIPQYQNIYQNFIENQTIYFDKVSSKTVSKQQKICLVYIHGFSERTYINEIKFLFPKLIKKIEMDIFAFHQPFHNKRSPRNQPYSGAYIFDSHPVVSIEGVRQAVHDVSQVISYAKDHYDTVIVGGFSLGGHIVSYLGTCDNRADLYIMGQAGANFPETLFNLTVCPGLSKKRSKWFKQSKDFIKSYQAIELLDYPSVLKPNQVLSVAGIYDKLITYNRVEKLRQHFKPTYIINYNAGHIGILFEANKVLTKFIKIIIDIMASTHE